MLRMLMPTSPSCVAVCRLYRPLKYFFLPSPSGRASSGFLPKLCSPEAPGMASSKSRAGSAGGIVGQQCALDGSRQGVQTCVGMLLAHVPSKSDRQDSHDRGRNLGSLTDKRHFQDQIVVSPFLSSSLSIHLKSLQASVALGPGSGAAHPKIPQRTVEPQVCLPNFNPG